MGIGNTTTGQRSVTPSELVSWTNIRIRSLHARSNLNVLELTSYIKQGPSQAQVKTPNPDPK